MSLHSESVAEWGGFLGGLLDPHGRQMLTYLNALSDASQAGISDLVVLAFGSSTTGACRPWSDVDLALVTDYFSGVPWAERIRRLGGRLSPPPLLSPIGLTHEEYATYTYPAIIRFVREHHVRLL